MKGESLGSSIPVIQSTRSLVLLLTDRCLFCCLLTVLLKPSRFSSRRRDGVGGTRRERLNTAPAPMCDLPIR